MREQYVAPLELKAVDARQRVISGYAAATGNVDEGGDVIDPGAFTDTLTGRDPGEILVPSVTHDLRSMPVGIPLVVREDARGLFTQTKIHNTQAGNDLLAIAEERLEAGRALGLSIGYKADPSATRYERKDGRTIRHIGRLQLLEYSFTAIPMNRAAVVTAVKSASAPRVEPRQDRDLLHAMLAVDLLAELRETRTSRR